MKRSLLVAIVALGSLSAAPTARSQNTYPLDFHVGLFTAATKRNSSIDDIVTDRSSTSVKGIEAFLAPPNGAGGFAMRILDGTYGNGKLKLREGRIFLGENGLRVEGAYGQRSILGSVDTLVRFARAGLRSVTRIGGSGFSLNVSGSKYFSGDLSNKKSDATDKLNGWEGETAIAYTAPRIPVFVQIGYRAEYFTFGNRAEYLNGVVLGTGVWLGGR
jgi:hypothetical protein